MGRNGENGCVAASFADRIRRLALSLPETYEDDPWGVPAFKVAANKVFAWMWEEGDALHVTLKLTAEEREIAHLLPYVRRARYLGRYGWVTATVTDDETLESALEWLRESYWLKAPAHLRSAVEQPLD
jgi:predicted DNA-binding protein (MmcQ/YjbR family)